MCVCFCLRSDFLSLYLLSKNSHSFPNLSFSSAALANYCCNDASRLIPGQLVRDHSFLSIDAGDTVLILKVGAVFL